MRKQNSRVYVYRIRAECELIIEKQINRFYNYNIFMINSRLEKLKKVINEMNKWKNRNLLFRKL